MSEPQMSKPQTRDVAAADRRLPLSDVVILDLSHVIAGPFTTMILADLGATVLKIEAPGRGDTARGTPPHDDGISHFFAAVNRNKYSVAIDLKAAEGKELFRKLVAKADVVLHNFRPGVMEGLGLGYDDLVGLKPDLVYCAMSGFGQDGPLRDRPAFDGVIQAMSGLMYMTGEAGGQPVRAGLSVGDYIPGLYAAIAVTAALRDRDRTGVSQSIDVSMFDCLFNIMGYYFPYYQLSGIVPQRNGGSHPTVVPMGGFPTADGHIVVAAFNQTFWRNLCKALGRTDWLDDPRFVNLTTRARHADELSVLLQTEMKKHTTDEWETIFKEFDVPCGPILSVAELSEHPQVEHRELLAHAGRGKMRVPARPIKYKTFRQDIRLSPPKLGEDTVNVLSAFGCVSGDDAERMLREGVIQDAAHDYVRPKGKDKPS